MSALRLGLCPVVPRTAWVGDEMSPMLFNICQRLWAESVGFGLPCHGMLAMPTQLFLTLLSNPKVAVETLNQCLEEGRGWISNRAYCTKTRLAVRMKSPVRNSFSNGQLSFVLNNGKLS